MPETLTTSYVTAKNTMHSTAPWVWLFSVDLDGTNGMNVCAYDRSLTVGGVVYSPFPIGVAGLTRDAEGNLPRPIVVVSNVSREIAGYLEAGSVLDRNVTLSQVLSTDLTTSIPWGTFTVTHATLALAVATFTLGVYALLDAPLPARRFARGRCDYVYGASECLYNTALANLIAATRPNFDGTTCDLSLEGGNGCRAHGENEAANGSAVFHPLRFGGHPSIPRGPAGV